MHVIAAAVRAAGSRSRNRDKTTCQQGDCMHAGSVVVCAIVSTVSCGGRLFYCSLGKPSHTFASRACSVRLSLLFKKCLIAGQPPRGDGPSQEPRSRAVPPRGCNSRLLLGPFCCLQWWLPPHGAWPLAADCLVTGTIGYLSASLPLQSTGGG